MILAAAYLTSLEPARQVASRQGIGLPQSLTFQDTAEGATIDVDIEPGRLGPNTVTVMLADRQGDPIANASGVDIRLSYLDADLGEDPLPTNRGGEGEFLANDVPINIAGAYQLEVTVRRPDTFDARTAFRFEVASGGARQQLHHLPFGGHRASALWCRTRRAGLHLPRRRHSSRRLVLAPWAGCHDPRPRRIHHRGGSRLHRAVRRVCVISRPESVSRPTLSRSP